MAGLGGVLAIVLPRRVPPPGLGYRALLHSLAGLVWHTPVLRQRGLYQACLFGAFSLFWTTVPLLLAARFGLGQTAIALFALAGVAGAIAAPIAGRLADRGWTRIATPLAMLLVMIALLLARLGAGLAPTPGMIALLASAILLDFGVTLNLVLGQRAILSLDPQSRARLNGLYLATLFVGGAISSAGGGWAYAKGGWALATGAGLLLPLLALLACAVNESRRRGV